MNKEANVLGKGEGRLVS